MLSSDLVRSVLESLPDAMIIVDATGRIRFANAQVERLFGYQPSEVLGWDIEQLLPERFRQRHVAHRQGYLGSVRVRPMGTGLELLGLRKDGTEFPVEVSLSPVQQGRDLLVAAAIRDMTQRAHTEHLLQQAREAADRANLAKSRFLATASHDLRQPLQTLGLLSGALRRLVDDPDALEALSQQELAISAMSRLLNALLDISKLESGSIKPDIADFPVAALFEELRGEFASLAADKGLQLSIESAAVAVRSDRSLVGQVLRNLLSNAIKYTHRGSVCLRCMPEPHGVRIQVVDTGVGIPADQLAYIYDEFYQIGVASNVSRDGYGLGLSIVQRLVKLLDLRLDVQSQVDKGSTFSLQLPAGTTASTSPHAVAGTRPFPRPASTAHHVLLVEDDAAVRNATRMLLKVEGYRVSTAGSLSQALAQAAETPDIDLLVTDYHLGGTETGLQVITAVRSAVNPTLKAVLVTGDTSTIVRELSHDAHLRMASKPINADELVGILKSLLAGTP
jgi:two-component system CheB/CheR fusion protein